MTDLELVMMKKQLMMMKNRPDLFERAIASGGFCAGFGGDLNGVHVPETFISGRLPPNVTPQQMFNQVVQFMEETIRQAELEQGKGNVDFLPSKK